MQRNLGKKFNHLSAEPTAQMHCASFTNKFPLLVFACVNWLTYWGRLSWMSSAGLRAQVSNRAQFLSRNLFWSCSFSLSSPSSSLPPIAVFVTAILFASPEKYVHCIRYASFATSVALTIWYYRSVLRAWPPSVSLSLTPILVVSGLSFFGSH